MATTSGATLTFVAILVLSGSATATPGAEEACLRGREFAAATYESCHHKVLGRLYQGAFDADLSKFHRAVSACSTKYQATWPKLQAKYPGTTCGSSRFVDNGDQTVCDNLTGLTWERKDALGGLHDEGATFSWSSVAPWREEGAAFAVFLDGLNGASFGGARGWRLPTFAELETIVSQAYPCAASPCIDAAFGPTKASVYLSSTTNALNPAAAWSVDFASGLVLPGIKASAFAVRGVRGG